MTEEELTNYLHVTYETEASQSCFRINMAEWAYATDVDNATAQAVLVMKWQWEFSILIGTVLFQVNETLISAEFEKSHWEEYFKDLNPDDYQNELIQREVRSLKVLGSAALSTEKLTNVSKCRY